MLISAAGAFGAKDFDAMREQMIDEVQADMRRSARYTGLDRLSPDVAEALSRVERHEFVPESAQHHAYRNAPLPIGEGQTISQPFIVGLMTELLSVDENSKVYELGTGSGYQAAVLGELVDEVYTVEIVESLGRDAEQRLHRLGYDNIHIRIGDGTKGWPSQAPFDGIIVTAAGVDVPPDLKEQLKPGGRMVIPVGGRFETQQLPGHYARG
ncbi:MAG: protein-L-isoaspartate(D-aspartate) O-methyltransferase [Gammaproteobacteria bacterium]|nr:protein-L-isoaspartate(D-aspartate) O-methyltransferase [Gammaproteobacteria bacterium]